MTRVHRFVTAGVAAMLAMGAGLEADVTIAYQGAMTSEAQTTSYIQGAKMRTDTAAGKNVMTVVFDIDAQTMTSWSSDKKEANVIDMRQFGSEIQKQIQTSGIKVDLRKNGQAKTILDRSCDGYDMVVTVPVMLGGQQGMGMTMELRGTLFLAIGAPGAEDYAHFHIAAAEKGFLLGTNAQALRAMPGQAKSMSELYRKIAALNGVPYEMTMTFKFAGEGPMAAMMARATPPTTTSTARSVSTSSIAPGTFAPPAGYTIKTSK